MTPGWLPGYQVSDFFKGGRKGKEQSQKVFFAKRSESKSMSLPPELEKEGPPSHRIKGYPQLLDNEIGILLA